MKREIRNLITACILITGFEPRVRVRVRPGGAFRYPLIPYPICGVCDYLEGEKRVYVITIANSKRFSMEEILAHEFVHAWVMQNHPRASNHGRTFQRTAAALRHALRYWGYDLEPLYTKGHDE